MRALIYPSRKQTFLTQRDAQRKLPFYQKRFGPMNEYRCRTCRMWHLTSRSKG